MINNVEQPLFIPINETLRLRKYDGDYETFLSGYQDPYVYQNSEGIFDEDKKPDLNYVKDMCEYLSEAGELYYIEVLENGRFVSVGDVTVKEENPPIAIWDEAYRRKGIGTAVMKAAIRRLKELGVSDIRGSLVYKWNTPSQRLHEKLGFTLRGETEMELLYDLHIPDSPKTP